MDIITRAEAQAQGLKHFFTGKPCKHGHVSKRYASTGQCKECVYAHTAAKSDEEKSRLQDLRKEWYYEKTLADPRYYADRAYARLNSNREEWNRKARERDAALTQSRGAHRSTIRRRANVSARVRANMQRRLAKAVGGSVYKTDTTMKLVGCTRADLLAHLQCQFTEGMTWDNYGEWHIDHIRPCESFDLTDAEQQRECFHFSNLQPLWAEDNYRKGAKLPAAA